MSLPVMDEEGVALVSDNSNICYVTDKLRGDRDYIETHDRPKDD